MQKHKKLLWQLLCLAGNTKNIQYHEWIGHKRKSGDNTKIAKLLRTLYPNKKEDEIELLTKISNKKEIIQLAKDNGIDEVKL